MSKGCWTDALFDCRPICDPAWSNQTKASDVPDSEFRAAFTPPTFSIWQRIVQFVGFIIFFGWLRLILIIVLTIGFVIAMWPLLLLYRVFGSNKPLQHSIEFLGFIYNRVFFFLLGVWWMRYKGAPPSDIRLMTFNHTSIMDGCLIWLRNHFSLVIQAESRSTPFIGECFVAGGAEFVERGRSGGGTAQRLKAIIEDPTRRPVAVSPEAKLSNGELLYGFRTGAFLTDYPVQPIAVRYWRILPIFGHHHAWLEPSFPVWLLRCLCSPGFIVVINFLPVVPHEVLAPMSPAERAEYCQLRLANYLGVKAITTTTKEFFKDQEDKKGA